MQSGQGLLPRVLCLEAEVLSLRDKCIRLDTECKILHDHVRELEEGRRQDRAIVEELRLQLISLRMQQHDDAACDAVGSAAGAADVAAEGGGSVAFAADEASESEDDDVTGFEDVGANGRKLKSAKQRVPTAFVRGLNGQAEEVQQEKGDGRKKVVVGFRDRESVLEIDNCVTGDVAQRRSSRRRVPTGYVKMNSKESLNASFNAEDDAKSIIPSNAGEVRPGNKKRVPTAFARVAMHDEEEEDGAPDE
eukprot:CAMPEP_0115742138 /NCGR_PEP_ID=MMETSP0272-20121206/90366_1 /TAXON_ID=71861 /ORGANISM="Scrippsiella trochoidea, Strain CCMP3099" /LENGTH=248 /DNA_ID=CAMNT_0003186837 /DNA_START=1 /DNA_END=744 /DNA_ORIENTATION=-